MKFKLSNHSIFWLLTLIVFCFAFLVPSIQQGMVLDGVVYSTIARNLAQSSGDFWMPRYTATVHAAFFEHPPLVFGIQAFFFKILGDTLSVERIYTFLTAVITGGMIVLIWRLIFRKDQELRKYSWLPLILWSILPINSWSFSNNLLENTMGIFALAAIALMVKDIKADSYFFAISAGVMVFLAVFSKGPAAFFPVAFYLLAWIVFRDIPGRRVLVNSLLILCIPLLVIFLLLLFPAPRNNFTRYISYQIVPSLKGDRLLGGEIRRSFILNNLFIYTLPLTVISIGAVFWGVVKKQLYLLDRNILRWSMLFILIGLSASLPLIISPKQNYNYLIPSIPYFALGLGVLIVPIMNSALRKIRWRPNGLRNTTVILGIILLVSLIYSVLQATEVKSPRVINYKYSLIPGGLKKVVFPYAAERIRREEYLLSDIHTIGRGLSRGSIISIPESLWEHWDYHAYFARFYHISLDRDHLRRLYLCEKGDNPPSERYRLEPLATHLLDLYSRR